MTEKELQIKSDIAKALAVELIKQKELDSLLVDRVITITNIIFNGINPEQKKINRLSILDMPIKDCGFSYRTESILRKNGIEKVGEMIKFHQCNFLKLYGFGKASLHEIESFAYNHQLKFSDRLLTRSEFVEKIEELKNRSKE